MLTNIFQQLRDPALWISVEEVVVIHHLILFRFFPIAAFMFLMAVCQIIIFGAFIVR